MLTLLIYNIIYPSLQISEDPFFNELLSWYFIQYLFEEEYFLSF